jgi:S1-C subfamily serine protease
VHAADVFLVLWVGLFIVQGVYRGLVAQVVALLGLAVGAFVGSWIAPQLVGGESSEWGPYASLGGAVLGAALLGAVAGSLAQSPRDFLRLQPVLRRADSAGGALVGGAMGLALAWLAAVVVLQQPGGARRAIQESELLPRLLAAVPPEDVLHALGRFDPLPLLPNFATGQLPPPDPSVVNSPAASAAARGVLKIYGSSCGLGAQGSGWVIRRNIVATNAHVIAGQTETHVVTTGAGSLPAQVVYVDPANDVALLRVQRLQIAPLAVDSRGPYPKPVVVLGYPHDGRLTATAGTAGEPRSVLAPDAYRRRVRPRTVVPLRGQVEPGESGGPVVDRRGSVVAMIFGGARTGDGGFGVPVELVLRGLNARLRPVSPGPCLG